MVEQLNYMQRLDYNLGTQARTGWLCPGCSNWLSPDLKQCPNHKVQSNQQAIAVGQVLQTQLQNLPH